MVQLQIKIIALLLIHIGGIAVAVLSGYGIWGEGIEAIHPVFANTQYAWPLLVAGVVVSILAAIFAFPLLIRSYRIQSENDT